MISKTIYLLPFLICLSCVDQLELQPAKGTEEGVTILGELVLGNPSIINIRINQLYNFDVQSYAPIPVRSVKLLDEAENEINVKLRSSRLYQHIFTEDDLIQVDIGQSYKIIVVLENGQRISSTYETLPPTVDKQVELIFETKETQIQDINGEIKDVEVVQFYANTSIDAVGESTRLFWTAERTFKITDGLKIDNFEPKTCYITTRLDFDNLHLLDGTLFSLQQVDKFPLSRVILNYEFAEGYYYTTYRKSLSKGAFEYYSRMKENVERDGSLFETPAGIPPTNLRDLDDPKATNIYGYFMTYQQDTFRLYVSPESVNSPVLLCPPERVFCPFVCCDCLGEPGSQLEKPDFWEE